MIPPLNVSEVEEVIGVPFLKWAHSCHEISLLIVRNGLIDGPARVARGHTPGVISQHSWIVLGDNCYGEQVEIIDPTLWSYDPAVEGIWYGKQGDRPHVPHGSGSIMRVGRPPTPVEESIELAVPVSKEAQWFLDLIGPLDMRGWWALTELPVEDWPAGEIYAAMDDTPMLAALVPIDRLGMLTDRNPEGLYF